MPTRHALPYRGRHRARRPASRRAAGVAGLTLATLAMLVALPGSAQAGPAGSDFAAPGSRTHATIQFDLFRSFTNCLAEAAHGDSMYPGIDPAEVNACLGL